MRNANCDIDAEGFELTRVAAMRPVSFMVFWRGMHTGESATASPLRATSCLLSTGRLSGSMPPRGVHDRTSSLRSRSTHVARTDGIDTDCRDLGLSERRSRLVFG